MVTKCQILEAPSSPHTLLFSVWGHYLHELTARRSAPSTICLFLERGDEGQDSCRLHRSTSLAVLFRAAVDYRGQVFAWELLRCERQTGYWGFITAAATWTANVPKRPDNKNSHLNCVFVWFVAALPFEAFSESGVIMIAFVDIFISLAAK